MTTVSNTYVTLVKQDDDSAIKSALYDTLSSADDLFFVVVDNDSAVVNSRHLKPRDLGPHKTKQKMKTLMKSLVDNREDELSEVVIQGLADSNFSLILGVSINSSHLRALSSYLRYNVDVDANSNLIKFAEICDNGGSIKCHLIENGIISAVQEVDFSTSTEYVHGSGFDTGAVNEDNASEFIKFISNATEYDGFNPKMMLKNLFKGATNEREKATIISLVLNAYIRIGNNMQKLSTKRVDQKVSREMMQFLSGIGVKRAASNADGITLARIAISMPGELLVMRRVLREDLQKQVESTLDVVYQDLAFQGVPEISIMAGYEKYAIDFSSLIYRKKNNSKDEIGVSESDTAAWNEFMKSFTRWNGIAKAGYSKNKAAKERYTAAEQLNLGDDPATKAFSFFMDSAKHYLKDDDDTA